MFVCESERLKIDWVKIAEQRSLKATAEESERETLSNDEHIPQNPLNGMLCYAATNINGSS